MLLEIRNLSVNYGTVRALKDVSFQIGKNEIVALIGPNGAGKSTALRAVSGILYAYDGNIETGEILFEEKSIRDLRTDELAREGISLVPEGRRVFASMTVLENLEMGAYTAGKDKAEINDSLENVFGLFPDLKDRGKQKAGTLSSGEQQMLALGRALMLEPALLLLDEPSLGLSPNYIELVFQKLVEINRRGTSILLVEQNAQMALGVCSRGYVFDLGSIVLEGKKETLLQDEKIKKVFLGL